MNVLCKYCRLHQLAFCDTVIERNHRYSLPVTTSTYSTEGSTKAQLESYFPFDPCLLPRWDCCIVCIMGDIVSRISPTIHCLFLDKHWYRYTRFCLFLDKNWYTYTHFCLFLDKHWFTYTHFCLLLDSSLYNLHLIEIQQELTGWKNFQTNKF